VARLLRPLLGFGPLLVALLCAMVAFAVLLVVVVDDAAAADLELAYVAETAGDSSITQTAEASAETIVTATEVTFDGSTPVLIEFFAPQARPDAAVNRQLNVWLYDGSSSIGRMGIMTYPGGTGHVYVPLHLVRRLTPSAAAHTYSVRATVSGGTGQITAGAGGSGNAMPIYIRVSRANPSLDGTGATALADLTDVNDAGKADGDVLKYDGTSSTWVAGTDLEGAGAGGEVSFADSEHGYLELIARGQWFLGGLLLMLMLSPQLTNAFRFWRE